MWYIWIGIIILLMLIECISTKTIWFILSGTLSFVLSFLIDSFLIQFLIFVIGGILLLEVCHDTIPKKEEEIILKIFPKKKKRKKNTKKH